MSLLNSKLLVKVLTVLAGGVLGQLLLFIAAPFVTRIYEIYAFDFFANITQTSAFLVSFISLCLLLNIVLLPSENEVKPLMRIAIWLDVFITTLLLLLSSVLWVFGQSDVFVIAVLVVLSNCKLLDSVTIKSLITSWSITSNTKFIFWNNGPVSQPIDVKELNGLDINMVESLYNKSLAKIYYQFIERVHANIYVVLDHDSEVSPQYIAALNTITPEECAFPVILNGDKATGPLINGVTVSQPTCLTDNDTLLAIGSNFINTIKTAYGNVFDERFYLYGIDSTFCYRLESLKLVANSKVILGFQYSLSRLESESGALTQFRKKERSYSFGLTLRYYKKLSYLRVLFILLFKRILNKSPLSIAYIFKALIHGCHYRDEK
ncbi:hypothetical protein [Pseudoalteromonas prydzensis]|uniref:hypothetical protein n=1 Tax=Pseudoalteromonas prydzensis TaxID=182141 RepID=UPI0024BBF999|nr:hypothetical protein [Pseudoalteromonas prydzensis]